MQKLISKMSSIHVYTLFFAQKMCEIWAIYHYTKLRNVNVLCYHKKEWNVGNHVRRFNRNMRYTKGELIRQLSLSSIEFHLMDVFGGIYKLSLF